uniref:Uncharacterized protein n=1 Tax=Oryza sativa subsp. japonica TaxID=39947 RepID=Q69RV9_ORYSJ|nr:hypothetical protein [Oryza sativa Japonica Group]BAD30987.1 hypothetical protein [Oryza sativa Japonica Group]
MAGGMAARAPTLLLFWPLWIGAVRQLKRLLSSSSGPIPIHPAPVPPYRRIPTSATASGSGRARFRWLISQRANDDEVVRGATRIDAISVANPCITDAIILLYYNFKILKIVIVDALS